MASYYSPRFFLLALFLIAIVLSPALPCDAAKSVPREPKNRPYCPACNCCKVEPPPPCCYCACSVVTSQPNNASP
ncbi:hypothetical protein RHMOL_Rhmol08G0304700 [Rhododendron molle]|uniref:Uncharacterized protein n=1 Tax=Rhododendron molle TaxID=49168 RepID=A0ACC0MVH8_RHOML|nr:hypothetical protein RHMOL_Rhmol08G0304700 [Rhododendron molle]